MDPSAYRLYALAVEGSGESATGDVYVHTLNADGTMASGGWSKVNTGLSGNALYALAANIPSGPTALFTGGEGINLYEATSGLDTGNPSWISSKTGLSNLLMARMPILFSGQCTLDVSRYRNDDTVNFIVYIDDVNGNPPISGNHLCCHLYAPDRYCRGHLQRHIRGCLYPYGDLQGPVGSHNQSALQLFRNGQHRGHGGDSLHPSKYTARCTRQFRSSGHEDILILIPLFSGSHAPAWEPIIPGTQY